MIQIDIPMPERCGVCFAMHTDEIGLESWCGIDETARDLYTEEINTKRPDWCPMKEQGAVTIKKTKEHGFGVYGGICPKCRNWIQSAHSFCGFCGQAVKWTK